MGVCSGVGVAVMVCWECKITHDDPSHVCSSCQAQARAEGRLHALVPKTNLAQRLMMQCLRDQGLSYHHIARVTGRSVATVYKHTRDLSGRAHDGS